MNADLALPPAWRGVCRDADGGEVLILPRGAYYEL